MTDVRLCPPRPRRKARRPHLARLDRSGSDARRGRPLLRRPPFAHDAPRSWRRAVARLPDARALAARRHVGRGAARPDGAQPQSRHRARACVQRHSRDGVARARRGGRGPRRVARTRPRARARVAAGHSGGGRALVARRADGGGRAADRARRGADATDAPRGVEWGNCRGRGRTR